MDLKYLFEAEYKDGKVFKQNKKDVSLKDPKRSAFFDVSQDDLVRFFLVEQKLLGHKIAVDLRDGHFEVDGLHLTTEPPIGGKLRIIFYRQHQHDFNTKTLKETAHRVTYFIGWKTNIAGKNYQKIIGVK